MTRVYAALVGALLLLALALSLVLSGSPPTVAGTDSVAARTVLGYVKGGSSGCQYGGTLPRGTSAVRLSFGSNVGPHVAVKILSGSRVVTQGARGAGWGIAESVTVPLKPLAQTIPNVTVCAALGPVVEPVEVKGEEVKTVLNGRAARVGRSRVEYLRGGQDSWWSLASQVARRMGLGRAASGTWVVFLVLALMAAVAFLSVRVVARLGAAPRPRRPAKLRWRPAARLWTLAERIPQVAWMCALVALLSAAAWSLITPPFQLPDEPSHFAYVQQLVEGGALPTSSEFNFSPEEEVALSDLHHQRVRFYPERQQITTSAEQRGLEADLARPLERRSNGDAGVAASEPPVYYTLQTIPYLLGSPGSILDRLALMRLFSALAAALTALFSYLFLREALPAAPWAWAVGGLAVALMPLLGFMSGGVNPDAMLFAVAAATFFCLARAFRRGLTPRLAIAIGLLVAVGLLTKLNFIGLAPGVIVGLLVLALRARRTSKREAYRCLALAGTIALAPAIIYILINVARGHAALGSADAIAHPTGGHGTVFTELGYIWQFYLPKLPWMATDFPGLAPWRVIWFDRSVGLYGWLDTQFPVWVYNLALALAAVLVALTVRAVYVARKGLLGRLPELGVYALMALGILVLTGAVSYLSFPGQAGRYGEPRYLLSLLALFGALIALSARGAGRRWGPVAGALIVVLFLAWDVFSQLQLIARFYG
jgi:hypothetical protein